MLSDLLIQLGLSLLFVALGSSMYRGNIKLLHSYHRKRIQKEDEPIVGKWCGMGLYCIALGLFLTSIFSYFTQLENADYILIPFLVIGILMNLIVIIKYNKGLF